MKKKISGAILKRLDALNNKKLSDVPAIVFISPNGEVYKVVEHYYSPQGNRYRRFTVNSPDEYVSKGGIILIDDIED